ncbi:putative protein of unknown function (DUF3445) [Lyophyllum shimeji]|uniref:Uncharacterized protein n=1 Tax=Lyophyllum shimeji TaxID=47721 RepID=A0A9P3PCQ0_LYOSH|nr:putative protein of unknown function (DUF3445) [Lyophyllum shimeji]
MSHLLQSFSGLRQPLQSWIPRLDARGFCVVVPVLLTATISLVYLNGLVNTYKSRLASEAPQKSTGTEKKVRKFGEWTPVDFAYPPITACPQEPAESDPIPYRPFRSGEYHVTMGIRSMHWDEWIELDNQYEKYHRIREHRIRTRGPRVIRVLPDNPGIVGSGADAAIETIHELAEYLSRRFPTTFKVERHASNQVSSQKGWGGAPPIKSIQIIPLRKSYDLPLDVNDGENAATRAMELSALLVQEDLALMIEGMDGRYYFQAGAICVPGFWRIQDKIGLPLDEIHTTGDVPRYKDKLQMSMERFFQRLAVDKPVARNNYFFQVVKSASPDAIEDIDPEELAWAESSNGTEDAFSHTHPAHQPTRPTPTPSTVRLRTERQTLRRLPRTGAILFTIRTYLTPIDELSKEPGVARRLASALRGWGEDIGTYKGKFTGGWWDVVLDYLDKAADKEADRSGEDIRKMENYPF